MLPMLTIILLILKCDDWNKLPCDIIEPHVQNIWTINLKSKIDQIIDFIMNS